MLIQAVLLTTDTHLIHFYNEGSKADKYLYCLLMFFDFAIDVSGK